MNKIPNWLRWLLFLPLSIIASIFVYPIIKIINSLFDSIPQLQLFLFIIGAGLTGYIFVIVAVKVVPKHKVMFSIIMASTYMILAGITLYEKLTFGKIIQMNMFETISLAVVGTISAVITCYQTYDDLISSSSEFEKLNDAYADNSLMQKLEEESDISDPNSEDLENEVVQIMSILDSEIGEFEEKQLAKDDLLSSFIESDELIDVYQDDSLTQELKEDKDNPEPISKDLEKQVLQPTSELDAVIEEPKREQLIEDDLLSGYTESDELIDVYPDDSFTPEIKEDKDIPELISKDLEQQVLQTTSELDSVIEELKGEQLIEDDLLSRSTESDRLIDDYHAESFKQELEEKNGISYLNFNDLEKQVLQTTTELNFILRKSKTNQLTKYVEDFYKSIGEDDKVALINTEIFHLWCMIVTIFEFSIDSNFRRKLIKFFNTKVINLYLKWKEFTKLDAKEKPYIDFNNFSYYSNQVRTNNIHLNSSFKNTDAEILFGKIVLSKIHECIGNKKVDVERETILMPVQVYYELKQRVIEILNRTTNMICY